MRRRRAARQRQAASSRHVAALAEKFRPPVPDIALLPEIARPLAFAQSRIAPPSQRYVVLYFALSVMSVLAAASVHNRTHPEGQRAYSSLIALTPKGVSRAVAAPEVTPLQEMAAPEFVVQSPAPPLAGLAALRETIQSRQVDTWLATGAASGTRTVGLEGVGETLRLESPDAAGSAASLPMMDDEFGAGLKAPGICELPEGTLSAALPQSTAAASGAFPDAEVRETHASLSSDTVAPIKPSEFGTALAAAAQRQTSEFTVYTDKYRRMSYPMGDVPALFGVCTDVIIRAYRALGIDLQALIHIARIGPADTSIAHRRTFTLRRFFASRGASVPISEFAEDYRPGDIVTYHRPQNRGSRDHIAIVSNLVAPSGRPMIVHNRGWGPQIEDALFVDKITGHYRYRGPDDGGSPGVSADAKADLGSTSNSKPKLLPNKPRAAEAKSTNKPRSGKPEAPTLRR